MFALAVVLMEEEVQVREKWREKSTEKGRHGKEQSEEQRSNERQSRPHHGRREDDMSTQTRS